MKNIFFCVTICFLLFFGTFVFADELKQEKIIQYTVDVTVMKNAHVRIVEKIMYDFGDEKKHGIYRDIPQKYKTALGTNRNGLISDISVVDESGKEYTFKKQKEGNNIRLKIGSAETYVSGKKQYIISYTVKNIINYFDTHDELYWNVIGTQWAVPIESTHITIHAPNIIKNKCFVGAYGSKKECTKRKESENEVVFETGLLQKKEGVTVAIGMTTGILKKPHFFEKVIQFIRANGIMIIPFIVGGILFIRWRRKEKKENKTNVIIPIYDAPKKMSPAEAGLIVKERLESHHLTSLILYLAVHRYIKIIYKEKIGTDTCIFEKGTNNNINQETKEVRELYEALFKYSVEDGKVDMSLLKNKFYKDKKDIFNTIRSHAIQEKYFVNNPAKVRNKYNIIGGSIIFIGFILIQYNVVFSVVLMISGIMICVAGQYMIRNTQKGARMQEQLKGLKMYMETAEKDRINFHNAPEKHPEQFEKLLPYAIAFGVEKKWAKQFEGIYNEQPEWFEGSNTNAYSSVALVNSLNSVQSSFQRSTNAPSSASSGGSGFSGGGSGGGFGGGGGGSW